MEAPKPAGEPPPAGEKQLRVTKRTLRSVLEQCRRALELLQDAELVADEAVRNVEEEGEEEGQGQAAPPSSAAFAGYESDELCDLLKSKFESPDFLDKLGRSYISVNHQLSDESATWDIVRASELWEDKHNNSENESEDDGFVFVKQEDIIDGIACFMAAYLSSLKQTKELTPDQLQEGHTFMSGYSNQSSSLQNIFPEKEEKQDS